MHNRWWAPDTVHARLNGGAHEFGATGGEEWEATNPTTQAFWEELLGQVGALPRPPNIRRLLTLHGVEALSLAVPTPVS